MSIRSFNPRMALARHFQPQKDQQSAAPAAVREAGFARRIIAFTACIFLYPAA